MQDFTADKINPFEMRGLDCNVHFSEYLKQPYQEKMSDTLLLSHHSYRCGAGYFWHAIQRSSENMLAVTEYKSLSQNEWVGDWHSWQSN